MLRLLGITKSALFFNQIQDKTKFNLFLISLCKKGSPKLEYYLIGEEKEVISEEKEEKEEKEINENIESIEKLNEIENQTNQTISNSNNDSSTQYRSWGILKPIKNKDLIIDYYSSIFTTKSSENLFLEELDTASNSNGFEIDNSLFKLSKYKDINGKGDKQNPKGFFQWKPAFYNLREERNPNNDDWNYFFD